MFSKVFTSAAVALAASSLVSAQTFTACDPTKKDCPADPAFGTTLTVDLKSEPKDVFNNLGGVAATFGADGAELSIKKDGDSPTWGSSKYMFFGRVEFQMKAAPGAGIVTSFVLQSDDLDEIDIEFVGGDTAHFQSNYFSKGDTTTFDRGATHAVSDPMNTWHTYAIDWTKDRVIWELDGVAVRTLTSADAKNGAIFPQTPMQVKFGTWSAGRAGAPEGTANWAGGYTNFALAPFNAYYKDIKITDNAGGVTGAKQYVYGDKTGTWQSIKIETTGGDVSGGSSSVSGSKSATASQSTQTTLSTTVTGAATTTTSAPTRAATTTSSTSAATPNAAPTAFAFSNVALAGAAALALAL